MGRAAWVAGASVLMLMSGQSFAEDGITSDTILLGRSAALTGPIAPASKENGAGAQLYFDRINKRGGIHGRKIVVKTLDDAGNAKPAIENTHQLIEKDKVFALFLYRGTTSTEAAIPVFTDAKIPLIAPISSSTKMSEPFNPYIFNTRARVGDEVEKIVEHLTTVGIRKIAVIHTDDGYGKDIIAAVKKSLTKRNLKATTVTFARGVTKFDDSIRELIEAEPQAVILGNSTGPIINAAYRLGLNTQFFTLSNSSSDAFIKELGENKRGIVVAQVAPYPWSKAASITKEFHDALAEFPGPTVSYATLEGYIAAKVMAEALKRAGPQPTREKLLNALEGMANFDVGGMNVHFASNNHHGSSFVDLTVVSKDGKFLR